ncbi:hypothetical protein [Streptomyces varsoviensis]|uniref:Uncharacterized protein n=1 Tax=Streptomyces varsoviensis TaxID=67373 RepID=A0ABR5IX72_9ACTN|nr:hypothetical protein [Streptomyces varsoviensis]KOG85741.1 hypothetical protein ADK38_34965 [Streptomyces varsoviensis]
MNGIHRRAVRLAVVGALGALLAVALPAAPAFAKSGTEIRISQHMVRVGHMFGVRVSGSESGGRGRYLRACVQGRKGYHGRWRTVKCGKVTAHRARVDARLTARHRGMFQFRGVLYVLSGPHDKHPKPGPASPAQTVRVH